MLAKIRIVAVMKTIKVSANPKPDLGVLSLMAELHLARRVPNRCDLRDTASRLFAGITRHRLA
ncbi:MAG TPA: hypothetical protein VFT32_13135 [Candidatus Eisenbacteria bacterium]|nr:hypothetical protein [Candidatus Eisenbacteria bacterium]